MTEGRTPDKMLVEANIMIMIINYNKCFKVLSGGLDMNSIASNRLIISSGKKIDVNRSGARNLAEAQINEEYTIKEIKSVDEELKNFLFTLGCYKGETVTVLSVLCDNYIISLKDARYSIDKELAQAIIV